MGRKNLDHYKIQGKADQKEQPKGLKSNSRKKNFTNLSSELVIMSDTH